MYCEIILRACTYREGLLKKPVFLVCQQVPGVFLNTTVHYRIHKSPAHIHILSLLNSFHTLLFTIRVNIIIQSTSVFQAVYCFQVSQPQFCVHFHTYNMPTHHIVLDLITRAVYEQTSQLPVASFLFLSCPSVTLRSNLQATYRQTDLSTPRVLHLRTHDKYDRLRAGCAVRQVATSPGRLSPNIRTSSV